jgi:C-terminal processing protease CtpA/Prc
VAKLAKAGLKTGVRVTEVDSIPIEELDQWQLDQRLAGANGPEITLQWVAKGTRQLAPLRVK